MAPTRAFDLTGEVALVTGAGSRMPGRKDIIRLAHEFLCANKHIPDRRDW